MGAEFTGPQFRGGTCNLGRERAVSGGKAGSKGRGQRAKDRRQSTVNPGAVLPELTVLLAAPMSKKRTLHSRPGWGGGR